MPRVVYGLCFELFGVNIYMPEGPSILIMKEAVTGFNHKKVLAVTGNTKIDKERMLNQKVLDFKTWGKHFLICFKGFTIRIHLLMYGSYRINEEREMAPRLGLTFSNGQLNFYTCSVRIIEGDINDTYDWSGDVMNPGWDPKKAMKKLKGKGVEMACDVLLNQDVFAGVGNIIKNEVLFRIYVHPESKVGELPLAKKRALVKQARIYTFDFYEWKKKFELRKHYLVYTKTVCPRCNIPLIRKKLGKTNRRSFYCGKCQVLY